MEQTDNRGGHVWRVCAAANVAAGQLGSRQCELPSLESASMQVWRRPRNRDVAVPGFPRLRRPHTVPPKWEVGQVEPGPWPDGRVRRLLLPAAAKREYF